MLCAPVVQAVVAAWFGPWDSQKGMWMDRSQSKYLKAIAHWYMPCSEIDQKPGYEKWRYFSIALHVVSYRHDIWCDIRILRFHKPQWSHICRLSSRYQSLCRHPNLALTGIALRNVSIRTVALHWSSFFGDHPASWRASSDATMAYWAKRAMRRSSCLRFSGSTRAGCFGHTPGLKYCFGFHIPSFLSPTGTKAATWLGSKAKSGLLSLIDTMPQCPWMRLVHARRTPRDVSEDALYAESRSRYLSLTESQAPDPLLPLFSLHCVDDIRRSIQSVPKVWDPAHVPTTNTTLHYNFEAIELS